MGSYLNFQTFLLLINVIVGFAQLYPSNCGQTQYYPNPYPYGQVVPNQGYPSGCGTPNQQPCGYPQSQCQYFPCYAQNQPRYQNYQTHLPYQQTIQYAPSSVKSRVSYAQPKVDPFANVPVEYIDYDDINPKGRISAAEPIRPKISSDTTYLVQGGQIQSATSTRSKPVSTSVSRTFDSSAHEDPSINLNFHNGEEVKNEQPVTEAEEEDGTVAPVKSWF